MRSIDRPRICFLFLSALLVVCQLASASDQDQAVNDILSLNADVEYGEYLAGECFTCHQMSGSSVGVPVIRNRPAPYLIQALLEYQSGKRTNQAMNSVATALGNEEIAAVAQFFSTLETN